MFGTIYKLENTVNGKLYIGQTTMVLAQRWACHVCEAKSDRYQYPLYRAIRKYGVAAFMCRHVAGKQKLSVGKNFALVKA